MGTLELLEGDAVAELAFTIGTPEALCGLLAKNPEVRAVREALRRNTIRDRDVEFKIRHWVADFKPGFRLRHEPALCALIVALEAHPTASAEEVITELSALRVQELGMASRVARVILRRRRFNVSANASASLRLVDTVQRSTDPVVEPAPQRVSIPNAAASVHIQVAAWH